MKPVFSFGECVPGCEVNVLTPASPDTVMPQLSPTAGQAQDQASSEDCTPPDWAVARGHAEQWKLHHNCK